MPLNITPLDPAATIRNYRQNYVNIRRLIMNATDAPADIVLATPADKPIMDLDLPEGLRQAISDFQTKNLGGKPFQAVKYMRLTNGAPDIVIEDDDPLPPEDALVTFSYTVSAVSSTSASIVTHQLVAGLS